LARGNGATVDVVGRLNTAAVGRFDFDPLFGTVLYGPHFAERHGSPHVCAHEIGDFYLVTVARVDFFFNALRRAALYVLAGRGFPFWLTHDFCTALPIEHLQYSGMSQRKPRQEHHDGGEHYPPHPVVKLLAALCADPTPVHCSSPEHRVRSAQRLR
jgi:hypothetical protein